VQIKEFIDAGMRKLNKKINTSENSEIYFLGKKLCGLRGFDCAAIKETLLLSPQRDQNILDAYQSFS
jgi:hypothetical protein